MQTALWTRSILSSLAGRTAIVKPTTGHGEESVVVNAK